MIGEQLVVVVLLGRLLELGASFARDSFEGVHLARATLLDQIYAAESTVVLFFVFRFVVFLSFSTSMSNNTASTQLNSTHTLRRCARVRGIACRRCSTTPCHNCNP